MTKTQLEIIDIIKDYMEKDFKEGVLIYNHGEYLQLSAILESINVIQYNDGGHGMLDEFHNGEENRIIGHYDITAVLKYVVKKGGSYDYNSVFVNKINIDFYGETYFISLKPLHLYTEQEDLNLLKLLEGLK